MKKTAFLSFLAVLSLYGAPTACPQFYLNGEAPDILNKNMAAKTKELCYEAFGVVHSGITKTPLWSAEHLTREKLESKIPRKDLFHEESQLPANERAELSDYAHSGYDRGHLSASADAPTPSAQAESFTLANMIPQVHENNAGIWADIESATRYMAKKEGEIYVITGPLFQGNSLKSIGRGVIVPTMIYKIIYSPKQQKGAAYYTSNAPGNNYSVVSIKDIESATGINFFPQISDDEKSQVLQLPVPKNNH